MSSLTLSPEASGSTAVAIDQNALLARCMGNVPFAVSLLYELELTGEQKVRDIAECAMSGDHHGVVHAAHGLKGAAAIIAAEPLRAVAAAIEEAGEFEVQDVITFLVANLQLEMARCLEFAQVFREQNRA
ncbi:Hpt domain-containing protein [Novipirellula rosea]|uniref:HPt domain-containing protein n=1 Tax=Novipirellula rosea TaxID=1031540 RepID=A0ABP8MPF0_9BACT